MLVAITCPACRHHGYAVKSTLPRVLLCSRCGSRNRFEAYETSVNKRADRRSMAAHPPRPSFVEQSLLPDDLVQLLWNDQFPFRRSLARSIKFIGVGRLLGRRASEHDAE